MNQPLRLARGEMLYSDVRHIYGPLSPYLHSVLYRVFGPSLGVLFTSGFLTTAGILALVYWLARWLMTPAASAVAVLGVMWLCAFKPAGNFILPYSFSSLHGCVLGLAVLALLLRFVQRRKNSWLVGAGFLAGLTTLAKTEFGFAAVVTGLAAVWLVGPELPLGRAGAVGLFAAPALALPLVVYAWLAWQVGWDTLVRESFLIPYGVPPPLLYFNRWKFGVDRPLASLGGMIVAFARVLALGGVVAAISLLLVRPGAGGSPSSTSRAGSKQVRSWKLLLASLLLVGATTLVLRDAGPFLAMPLILIILLVQAWRDRRAHSTRTQEGLQALTLLLTTVFALTSLARTLLRVTSGGAYSSYMLPASVILFTYLCVVTFPGRLENVRARRLARNMALGILFAGVTLTAAVGAFRYRVQKTADLRTPRGTLVTYPDHASAFRQAMRFLDQETAPGDPVAVFPEGTSLLFFTNRRNPLREEITTPGFLDAAGEERAIRQLAQSNTRVVFIANRPTSEFGARRFGRDYNLSLMRWIEDNFQTCGVFGPQPRGNLEIGDNPFFLRAYCRKPQPGGAR